jgi:2-keto-4-pentenoate hydratase/2-oxohepta-3-ene-1,7-dioic acid hydratase in catechol pathway
MHGEHETRAGVLADDQIYGFAQGIKLAGLLGDDGERLHQAGEDALKDPDAVVAVADVELLSPLPTPPTIRDFLCFEQHLAGVSLMYNPEATVRPGFYKQPVFYFSNPYAVVGPDAGIPIPPGCSVFDYELEVAAVVGLAGRNLAPDAAERHIVGYTIMNDWSARDIQGPEMEMGLGPAKGKDTVTSLGPFLVTADELAPYRSGTAFDLDLSVTLNGREMGRDRWSSMYWSYAELLAYASRGTMVGPGDIIGSGTCGMGCLAEGWGRHGNEFSPPLAVGDVVELTVEGIGRLRNTVVAGDTLIPLRPEPAGAAS